MDQALADVAGKRRNGLAYGGVGAGTIAGARRRAGGAALAPQRANEDHVAALAPAAPQIKIASGPLVKAGVNVSDVVTGAPREELVDALIDAGVNPIEVHAGERFDSRRHQAVGRVVTNDRSLHNRVAETKRTGKVDHGRRLRYPDVLVGADGGAPS